MVDPPLLNVLEVPLCNLPVIPENLRELLQEYGKRSSTTSAFQRGQGWGSAVHVLLLKKEGIERGMFTKQNKNK